jgi:hypothetical protein
MGEAILESNGLSHGLDGVSDGVTKFEKSCVRVKRTERVQNMNEQ